MPSVMTNEAGISPAEYTWRELKGFAHIAGRTWCLNCLSEVLLFETVRDNCPNDECYNFARGVDFWLTGEEWLVTDYDT